jgi:hypothetical protein
VDHAAPPAVAVVGGADPEARYDPPVADIDGARAACEELGRELAIQGCSLIVYTSDPKFIEAHVVRGYVASGKARPGSIVMLAPAGNAGFAERQDHRAVFAEQPDTSKHWEVSFYRSLVDAGGVLLVGGGRSTHITGLVALSLKIPVLAVATFGGNAKKVWEALGNVRNDATKEDVAAMGQAWHPEQAEKLVASLVSQSRRRAERERTEREGADRAARRSTRNLMLVALLFVAAAATIPLGHELRPGTLGSLLTLVLAPLLASAAGASIRSTLDEGQRLLRTTVLGMVAGGLAALLFIGAQLVTTPDILTLPAARKLLFFLVPVAFVGGLTFDSVYRKLRSEDVVVLDGLKP